MKRLTIKTAEGPALDMNNTYPTKEAAREDLMRKFRDAVNRLSDYEDIGLMPEEIKALILVPNSPLTLETMREVLDAQREVAEEIAEDFIEFVTGGVQNAAEYCANMRPECCESPGWCTGKSKECKGFFPKAAKGPEEEKR